MYFLGTSVPHSSFTELLYFDSLWNNNHASSTLVISAFDTGTALDLHVEPAIADLIAPYDENFAIIDAIMNVYGNFKHGDDVFRMFIPSCSPYMVSLQNYSLNSPHPLYVTIRNSSRPNIIKLYENRVKNVAQYSWYSTCSRTNHLKWFYNLGFCI